MPGDRREDSRMKLMVEIRMDNAAFEDDPSGEVSRILRTVV